MKKYFVLYTGLSAVLMLTSCKKFLTTDLSESEVVTETVFSSDENATSALLGIYHTLIASDFAGGGGGGIPVLTGLSGDELTNPRQSSTYIFFERNNLPADNQLVKKLWADAYKIIYQTNSVLEGVAGSSKLTTTVRKLARGEALAIRAYCYFTLSNTFGAVPLLLNADYRANAIKPRTNIAEVRKQVIADLLEAQPLLSDEDVAPEKIRMNKAAALALLAKVYLYEKEWQKAIDASATILSGNKYSIETDLNQVFVKGSREVIWQLATDNIGYARDGGAFYVSRIGSVSVPLRDALVTSFEANDMRVANWIGSFNDGTRIWKFAHKYKVRSAAQPPTENYVVFRLAEQYLIRAEALANLNRLADAIADLDTVRARANLPLFATTKPGINQADLLDAIMTERRHELFSEGGNRWFDIARLEKSQQILGTIKPDWSINDLLYPVPQLEIDKNENLKPQNAGY